MTNTFDLDALDFETPTIEFGAMGDLDRLADAHNFFNWILDTFEPAIGNSILEVGAGTGTITKKLLDRRPGCDIVAIEPATNLWNQLVEAVGDFPEVELLSGTLADNEWSPELARQFDTALYLNVLEHIEDDSGELITAAEHLRPGGHVLVFVPAMPKLYSKLDRHAGHYRRYTKKTLTAAAEAAGLEIQKLVYFDVVNALPYWLVYTVGGREKITASSGWLFDKVLVPLSKFVQRLMPSPPVGKNLIMIARKPTAPLR